jgi:hypothetical protein
MSNPFKTRATEYISSQEAFLSIVTPEPLIQYYQKPAQDDGLYSRLVVVHGTPGSGKTTVALTLEFSALTTLMRNTQNEKFYELISALQKCKALEGDHIRVAACRVALEETDYNEIWHLPYSVEVRKQLFFQLIQARSVIAWFGQFKRSGIEPTDVKLKVRSGFENLVELIGGTEGHQLLGRANEVERNIYKMLGALLAPPESEIQAQFDTPFRLFDCLEAFELDRRAAQHTGALEQLIPLVILDDAHHLHNELLTRLKSWLVRRELKVARWILSRLDVLQPTEVFDSAVVALNGGDSESPGTTTQRDFTPINLQSINRTESRRVFRPMAKKMGNKYLRLMPVFHQNDIEDLAVMLPDKIDPLAPSNIKKLETSVQVISRKFKVSEARLKEYARLVNDFLGDELAPEDVRLAMLKIVVHRYAKRVPQQELLLAADEDGPDPKKPIKIDADIRDAAEIHLHHAFGRPLFVGIDVICDSASENAEQFLRMMDPLVEAAATHLLKQRRVEIQPKEQQRMLKEKAHETIAGWDFPEAERVRKVTRYIAERCQKKTLEPNAPLGPGANAYGLLKDEFTRVAESHPELARVLKFAVAYNAICLVPTSCKNKLWCLLELGGPLIIEHGLPWKRGGFIEGNLLELADQLK